MNDYLKDLSILTKAISLPTEETDKAAVNIMEALALLHDFEVWYCLDDMTKIRGKNKLEHLKVFMENLHKEKEPK